MLHMGFFILKIQLFHVIRVLHIHREHYLAEFPARLLKQKVLKIYGGF